MIDRKKTKRKLKNRLLPRSAGVFSVLFRPLVSHACEERGKIEKKFVKNPPNFASNSHESWPGLSSWSVIRQQWTRTMNILRMAFEKRMSWVECVTNVWTWLRLLHQQLTVMRQKEVCKVGEENKQSFTLDVIQQESILQTSLFFPHQYLICFSRDGVRYFLKRDLDTSLPPWAPPSILCETKTVKGMNWGYFRVNYDRFSFEGALRMFFVHLPLVPYFTCLLRATSCLLVRLACDHVHLQHVCSAWPHERPLKRIIKNKHDHRTKVHNLK